jgi:hypothetical protein
LEELKSEPQKPDNTLFFVSEEYLRRAAFSTSKFFGTVVNYRVVCTGENSKGLGIY